MDKDIPRYERPEVYRLGTVAELTRFESSGSADPGNCWGQNPAASCFGESSSSSAGQGY
jgi:hypothetical protein